MNRFTTWHVSMCLLKTTLDCKSLEKNDLTPFESKQISASKVQNFWRTIYALCAYMYMYVQNLFQLLVDVSLNVHTFSIKRQYDDKEQILQTRLRTGLALCVVLNSRHTSSRDAYMDMSPYSVFEEHRLECTRTDITKALSMSQVIALKLFDLMDFSGWLSKGTISICDSGSAVCPTNSWETSLWMYHLVIVIPDNVWFEFCISVDS